VWPARTRYVLNGRLQASRAAAGSPLAEDNCSDVLWLGSRGMRCDTRFALFQDHEMCQQGAKGASETGRDSWNSRLSLWCIIPTVGARLRRDKNEEGVDLQERHCRAPRHGCRNLRLSSSQS
jgi:hypothetical protein